MVVPCAVQAAAITGASASVGKPGYGMVEMLLTARRGLSQRSRMLSFSIYIEHPISSSTGSTALKCSGQTPRSSTSPFAMAQQHR